jgi:hypothetical protein
MRLRLVVGVAAIAVAVGAFAGAGGAAPAECSRATALEVGRPYAFDPARPAVSLVACGAFLGPGSEAMVVTFGSPTCWPVQSWAVFGLRDGTWRLVKRIASYLHPPLVITGTSIRETTAVHRAGDPRCLPSGGRRARTWRWNGTDFVAGPWTTVTPGARPRPPAVPGFSGFFKTPSRNIVCGYGFGSAVPRPFVSCRIKSGLVSPSTSRGPSCFPAVDIGLNATGRAKTGRSVCRGEPEGDAGVAAYEALARVLGYGATWSGGGFRCTSAVAGLTCRNRSGNGFFLSRARWRSF